MGLMIRDVGFKRLQTNIENIWKPPTKFCEAHVSKLAAANQGLRKWSWLKAQHSEVVLSRLQKPDKLVLKLKTNKSLLLENQNWVGLQTCVSVLWINLQHIPLHPPGRPTRQTMIYLWTGLWAIWCVSSFYLACRTQLTTKLIELLASDKVQIFPFCFKHDLPYQTQTQTHQASHIMLKFALVQFLAGTFSRWLLSLFWEW